MTARERRQRAHRTVATLISTYIRRDETDAMEVDWDERELDDQELRRIHDYHERLGSEPREGQ